MRKMRNKRFCLVMALVFAFTMVFPFAAFAADYSRIGSVSVVDDDGNRTLSAVKVVTTGGELENGDVVIMRLPKDFEFCDSANNPLKSWDYGKTVSDDVYYGDYNKGCYIFIPNDSDNGLNGNAVAPGTDIFDVTVLDENEISIKVDGNPSVVEDGQFFIYLKNVYVDDGFDGDIELTMDAPPGSGFDDNSVVVGRVSGGAVEVEVTDTDNFSNKGDVSIRITEDRAGAFEEDDESVKFVLPDGFVWDDAIDGEAIGSSDVKVIYGTGLAGTIKVDEDELIVNVTDDTGDAGDTATCIEITATIEVDDETDAKLGDIVAKIKGESDITPSEVIVGTYGEYEVNIEAADPTVVYAGKLEQEIADITIEEVLEDSLVNGRTITMTLPSWAKWGALPDKVSDGSVDMELVSFPGKDGQIAKYEVKQTYGNDATLELEDMEVVLSPAAPAGDLVVEIGGTQGLNAELVVAQVKAPVEVAVTDAPTIVIGKSGQAIAEVTITEADAGMLDENKDLVLSLPKDVEWDEYEVEVIEGDLELGDIDDVDEDLIIEIKDASNDASAIKVTGSIVAYRTVPEGDVTVEVSGDALLEVNDVKGEVNSYYSYSSGDYWKIGVFDAIEYDEDGLFEDETTIAEEKVAFVGTPAPSDKKLTTSIALGDNGSYISDGRIMVQLRDAANSLGVAPQNIFWDNTAKAATFIKGERVVQLIVGDPQVKLNGVSLPTDKGAEIKDGRTFVSLSAAGIALGATASWDNTAKVATLTIE